MESEKQLIEKKLSYLGKELLEKIFEISMIKTVPANTELVKEGQFVKFVPIVLSGLLKVFTRIEDKELLLYYIQPEESCIMSFSSSLNGEKSRIVALSEEECTLLLMPSEQVKKWVQDYPSINTLFYKQYDLRYSELIETINHLIYHRLDKRLLDYLIEKSKVTKQTKIHLSHKEIARDLGTAREVISRLMKKLEKQELIRQTSDHIEILSSE